MRRRDPSRALRPQCRPARAWASYLRLPRKIAALLAVAVFLFPINVFTGLNEVWFHWPVAPMLLVVVVLWAVMSRKGA